MNFIKRAWQKYVITPEPTKAEQIGMDAEAIASRLLEVHTIEDQSAIAVNVLQHLIGEREAKIEEYSSYLIRLKADQEKLMALVYIK